ncbi:AraC-like ligand-binding domain-containing protein [Arthrobacter burdickii]|uniref:Helix-turn-helix domain-containing protein n=1 Tax=Arthrobacter burdickii TaxID=3035920 RepID=A0ABT8JZ60_9MICC|nr:helix-turn-helix domain-containing protein [Arthrobacter burdickii]MDN4610461.1 helix-turn-helix domain-containing protein [Arthrobacter burdickii]
MPTPSPKLDRQNVTTSSASSVEEWRHIVAQSFVPLVTEAPARTSFQGTMRSRSWDRTSIVEISADGHEVHRTPGLIERSDQRYFKLNVQLEGAGFLVQGNREAMLQPGDMAVYDTTKPYSLVFERHARMVVVMFPHDALTLSPDLVGQLSAVPMSSSQGIAGIVGPFIRQMAENLAALKGPSGARLASSALELVATMLHSELDERRDALTPHALLLASVHDYIEANLGDPSMSPASIAAAHFISTRHLHHLFQDSGTTVASWIRHQRLERTARDLRDPLQTGKPVSSIANRWGFVDAAHFSRAFRDAYGQSPSSWKSAA